jgi:hypothetical protein
MQAQLGAKSGTYSNGMTFADVLTINHFGSETIPPRPVLRIAAERIIEQFMKGGRFAAFLMNMKRNPRDAKRLETVFLQDIARQTIAEAKRIIDSGSGLQHNAPATVAKKGFDKPLYVTGELEKHLGYDLID